MNDIIESIVEHLTAVFKATDESLNEWSGEGNLQFPVLLGMLAVKMNWDEKQVREADPFIRHYVRSHPDWYVTRGAHGGIMKTLDKQKREAAKVAKATVKEQLKAAIEAKTASTTDTSSTNNSPVPASDDSEQSE